MNYGNWRLSSINYGTTTIPHYLLFWDLSSAVWSFVIRYAKIGIILPLRKLGEKVYFINSIMHNHAKRQKCLRKTKYSKSPMNFTAWGRIHEILAFIGHNPIKTQILDWYSSGSRIVLILIIYVCINDTIYLKWV